MGTPQFNTKGPLLFTPPPNLSGHYKKSLSSTYQSVQHQKSVNSTPKTVNSTPKPSLQHQKQSVQQKPFSSTRPSNWRVFGVELRGVELGDVLNWRVFWADGFFGAEKEWPFCTRLNYRLKFQTYNNGIINIKNRWHKQTKKVISNLSSFVKKKLFLPGTWTLMDFSPSLEKSFSSILGGICDIDWPLNLYLSHNKWKEQLWKKEKCKQEQGWKELLKFWVNF